MHSRKRGPGLRSGKIIRRFLKNCSGNNRNRGHHDARRFQRAGEAERRRSELRGGRTENLFVPLSFGQHFLVSFIRTGLRELGLKVRRQRTRMALRHVRRQLQRSEIYLGRRRHRPGRQFPGSPERNRRSQEARTGTKGSRTADCTNRRRAQKNRIRTG